VPSQSNNTRNADSAGPKTPGLPEIKKFTTEPQSTQRRIFVRRSCFAGHADYTVNSLRVISHRRTQTQRTRTLDRIYRISRIEHRDRWKPRYAGLPRLRLGNNGKLWSVKMCKLILAPHEFPFFQAIQLSQFLKYLRNLRNLPAIPSSVAGYCGGRARE
jgi:hypothetical protein